MKVKPAADNYFLTLVSSPPQVDVLFHLFGEGPGSEVLNVNYM